MKLSYEDIQDEFISRNIEVELFLDIVMGMLQKRVLVVHGIGGLGKTWLLVRLGHECSQRDWPFASMDFSNGLDDYLSVLTAIADQINRESFETLNEVLAEHVAMIRDSYVPSVGGLKDAQSTRPSAERFTGSLSSIAGAGLAGITLAQSINSVLQRMRADVLDAFMSDIKTICDSVPAILFFDTYERIEDTPLGDWLKEFLILIAKEQRAFTVVAGRNKLNVSREWRKRFHHYELGFFSKDEVEEYLLENRQLVDLPDGVISAVFGLTRGHPLCVGLAGDLLEDRWEASSEAFIDRQHLEHELNERMVSAFLMERILERMDSIQKDALMKASITRWFDASMLESIGGIDKALEIVDRLRKYSFVRSGREENGYTLHEIVRELLLVKWYQDDRQQFLNLNERALMYFESLVVDALPAERGRYNLERLHHLLIVDQDKGMLLFQHLFKQAEELQQIDYCQSLLAEVKRFPMMVDLLTGD